MKKLNKVLLAIISIFAFTLFTACNSAKEKASIVIDDTKASYDKAAAEVKAIKDKTVETINEIENAAKEVQEATDAVKKITE